uniref:Uncharacterized protein n=1 Tax=Arundo donax TaxID=35708 RepID=A0A0A8ZVQ7_ARUDO
MSILMVMEHHLSSRASRSGALLRPSTLPALETCTRASTSMSSILPACTIGL